MSTALAVQRKIDRPRPSASRVVASCSLIALAVVGAWSVASIGINVGTLVESADNAGAFLSRMVPLNFPEFGELVKLIVETLSIVFLATVVSVVLSIPLAVWAATPTAPNSSVRYLSRAVIVLMRSIPDLVLAIIFMRMFGLGALGGILAMGLHSIGMVGKLYSDAIEELDDGSREAIESVGATRGQQMWAAITQPLMPQIIATALHRFDINLRTSVLLGYVGVGGLGMEIANSLRMMNYKRGMALALVVLLLCIAVELISGALRAAILSPSGKTLSKQTWADRLFVRTKSTATRDAEKTSVSRGSVGITPPWSTGRLQRFAGIALLIALIVGASIVVELSPKQFLEGLKSLPDTAALFIPPSDGGMAEDLFLALFDTLKIALAATFIGAVLALPIGILAARNVVANRVVHGFFRILIVVVRGIPELILAIVFVVISGLGVVAGTLALSLGAVGLLSKLVADSLEETDTAVQEAIRTSGASEFQIFFSATLRQAAPAFVAHTLYLLDTNIRSATLLGVVGAGGIGFQLLNASRVNQFDVVTYILILMVAVVLVVEFLSLWLRKSVR
ncbi:phosphonate ABC transporter, permease protein PhnE [Corynebacterium aurimucosum]|uniref:Phosphonate ABC transporter, permease protein PhnE n=1 Tax=Corynebacterium guaraldiae TaxID=3051103 RepID=A0ABY3CT02_9CORY|nr:MULTISPECIES: phosphonate ABC transporter, permease protein PhnE [Corynebacterium]MCZ9298056.1 phosphonate ABC transporter, permease protein PhnE [Corynebacterium hesseae]MTE10637.1 phosphonate ABC transporter, permease protein PhnE [Corynebacterium guaraldiae]TRX48442.1 phosphonate ABC transporter, permease protein PhnE [Corynebacterium guaraldiae]